MDKNLKIAKQLVKLAMELTVDNIHVGQIWYSSVEWKMYNGSKSESVTFYKVTNFNPDEDRIDFAEIGKKQQGGDDAHPLMVPDENKIVKNIDGLKYSMCIKEKNGTLMCMCLAMIALPWDGEPFKETHF